MRFVSFDLRGQRGLALADGRGGLRGLLAHEPGFPGDLDALIPLGQEALTQASRGLMAGSSFQQEEVTILPPLAAPPKIICVGLNYREHSRETGFEVPAYPALFVRFRTCLIGHRAALVRPRVSKQLDYEGELVAVVGRGGRHISKASALEHIVGYSIFNDASIRDYQMRTTQWTVGKNFDATGAFGPWLVTRDELPPGAAGLKLQTRLQGKLMQEASTSELIFDVATLVSLLSEAFTLEPGDLIVTGTPSGVGFARKPPVFMQPGDLCEIEIEGIGTLVNPVADEAS
ncbi:MAG TPA: fumarylacetoacetate hydrolase family protein [Steroidobacteraceae bacterium]|jgi:2-keto-4-pentenoate hydratase/2-oxohepta-3-ene-1,7-dioic acid hydratase in catechol pathway